VHNRRLERQIRRINGEGPLVRTLCALIALTCIATALLLRDTPGTSFLLVLAAVIPAGVWLRRYNHARPRHGAAVYDLAVGAFLGALVAAVWIHEPESLHEWLRLPGERAAPAAAVVLVGAMLEDLARELLWIVGAHD
jgi:hypothetical protein